jgi:hypothetical protein
MAPKMDRWQGLDFLNFQAAFSHNQSDYLPRDCESVSSHAKGYVAKIETALSDIFDRFMSVFLDLAAYKTARPARDCKIAEISG